jgi:putative phage-type endonuclease
MQQPTSESCLDNIEQRTVEWYAARCGKVTASRIGDLLKTLKNGNWAASRRNYAAQLVTERLTGKVTENSYTNEYMEWGTEQEPVARDKYMAHTGNMVNEVGFIDHPNIPMSGASPDGVIGDDGLLEIKCLIKANHIDILLTEDLSKFLYQIYWQMACTGRKWCDFISYNPELPEHMRLFVKRVERDEEEIARLEWEVTDFLAEVDATTKQLQDKFGPSVP